MPGSYHSAPERFAHDHRICCTINATAVNVGLPEGICGKADALIAYNFGVR